MENIGHMFSAGRYIFSNCKTLILSRHNPANSFDLHLLQQSYRQYHIKLKLQLLVLLAGYDIALFSVIPSLKHRVNVLINTHKTTIYVNFFLTPLNFSESARFFDSST